MLGIFSKWRKAKQQTGWFSPVQRLLLRRLLWQEDPMLTSPPGRLFLSPRPHASATKLALQNMLHWLVFLNKMGGGMSGGGAIVTTFSQDLGKEASKPTNEPVTTNEMIK